MRDAGSALAAGVVLAFVCLHQPPAAAQYPSTLENGGTVVNHSGTHTKPASAIPDDSLTQPDINQTLSPKQKRYIAHVNLERSKSDAAELAALAKALREDLNKPNPNGLSLEAMARIDRIQKLAKKIREQTKGF